MNTLFIRLVACASGANPVSILEAIARGLPDTTQAMLRHGSCKICTMLVSPNGYSKISKIGDGADMVHFLGGNFNVSKSGHIVSMLQSPSWMPQHTKEQWASLCEQVKTAVPTQLGEETWYLLIAAALSASPDASLLAEFYLFLVENESSFTTADAIARLSLRLRDLLLKETVLIGAPNVLMLVTALAKAEGSPESKAKGSERSNKWKNLDAVKIYDRGNTTIDTIYGQSPHPQTDSFLDILRKNLLQDKVFPSFGQHSQDIQFMELFTAYGLYLSDFEHLTPLETETLVFVTISCLGFKGPTLWHMRGMGRLLGARGTDESTQKMEEIKNQIRGVKVAAMTVVEFVGADFEKKAKLEDWPNVGDVKRDFGGWGEDALDG